MTLIGFKIEHIKYGIGQIISQDNTYITVQFENNVEFKFKFPSDSYKNFFRFVDLSDQELEEIMNDTSDDPSFLIDDENEEDQEIEFDDKYNYQKSNFYAYIDALEKEKDYIFKFGGQLCHIENGNLIKEDSFNYIYSYEHDGSNYFADDSSIRITINGNSFYGRIIVSDEILLLLMLP